MYIVTYNHTECVVWCVVCAAGSGLWLAVAWWQAWGGAGWALSLLLGGLPHQSHQHSSFSRAALWVTGLNVYLARIGFDPGGSARGCSVRMVRFALFLFYPPSSRSPTNRITSERAASVAALWRMCLWIVDIIGCPQNVHTEVWWK